MKKCQCIGYPLKRETVNLNGQQKSQTSAGALKQAFCAAIRPDDIQQIAQKLVEMAAAGDLAACKLVFERLDKQAGDEIWAHPEGFITDADIKRTSAELDAAIDDFDKECRAAGL